MALSVTLTAVSGCITMLAIPFCCQLAALSFAPHLPELSISVVQTILQLILIMGLPLIVGMIILSHAPHWAQRFERYVKHGATVLLALLIIGALLQSRRELATYGWLELLPAIVLSLGGLMIGITLSILCHLKPTQRITIPIEVGTQNGALAIGLALTTLNSQAVAFPAVIYGTFMYLPCAFMVWLGHKHLRSCR